MASPHSSRLSNFIPSTVHRRCDPPPGRPHDIHAHDLASLAATVVVQLSTEGDATVSPALEEAGATYTAAGVELLLQHMLLCLAHKDLEIGGEREEALFKLAPFLQTCARLSKLSECRSQPGSARPHAPP